MALVVVYTSNSKLDVDFANSFLQQAGIEGFIENEHLVGTAPYYSQIIGGIRLLVRKENENEARNLIRAYVDSSSSDFENAELVKIYGSCSKCGSKNLSETLKPGFWLPLISILLLAIPIPVKKRFIRCRKCGFYWKK